MTVGRWINKRASRGQAGQAGRRGQRSIQRGAEVVSSRLVNDEILVVEVDRGDAVLELQFSKDDLLRITEPIPLCG